MMKQLKKALSILCAIALLISSLAFALAEDTPEDVAAQQAAAEQAAADEAAAKAAEEEAAAQAAAEAEAAAQAAAEAEAARIAEEQALEEAYAAADKAEKEGELEEALEGFEALGNYRDSQNRVKALKEKIKARDEAAAAAQAAAEAEAAAKAAEEEAAAAAQAAAEAEAAAKAAEEEAAAAQAEEEPAAEEPAAEEPASEEPASEEPASEEPASEEPASEEPASEEPASEEPASEEPASEEPASEEPASEEPASEEPASEEPASEEPASEEPASEEPASEEPASEEPASEEPASEEPSSEEPAEEEPAEEEASDNNEEEEEDDDLVQLEDNEGYVDEEVIEENTPAITDELKGLRNAEMYVGEVLTDSIRFGDELTVTLKGCDVSTVELMLYVPAGASINTKVDGKAVSFTPVDSDVPSMNLYVYELTNAAGRNHEIVLTSYDTVTFSLVASVKQVEEMTEEPAAEEEVPAAEENNETPVADETDVTPAAETSDDETAYETPAETPAPTIQASVKTYEALKVGRSISDTLVGGQKAKIQVKCGKNPYVTLTLNASSDDVTVTIDGQAAQFSAAGNGTYVCDLDEVAFRKFSVVISAKQDLSFTLSAEARGDEVDESFEEEVETEEAADTIINEETDEEPAEEIVEEVSEEPAAEDEEVSEEVTEETEVSEEEPAEETEEAEDPDENEGEEAEGEEENTEEETVEETEEEAAEAEPLTDDQLIELGYRKVAVQNKNGADIYAGTEEAEVIGHADLGTELWIKDAETEGWAEIYTEEETQQFINLAEIEKQPLTDEEIEALGFRKVQILNENGTDIYDNTEEEAAVIGHADFESELWIRDLEAEGWAEIYTEEGARFVKLAEIEKQPLTDEEIEALGFRKVQVLNQHGTDIYDSTEEKASVIGHADSESEIWIRDLEAEGWAEVYNKEEIPQFIRLDELEKQMPSDEEMLEAGYIKVYVAIDIGANIYESSAEYEGEEAADHLEVGTELWVKLSEDSERAQIFNLDDEAPVRYINLVDIIATMKPEGMEDLPTRELKIVSSLGEAETVAAGTVNHLEVQLINFREDDNYTVQWKYSEDGETFIDIEDAVDLEFAYMVTMENGTYIWRVSVVLVTPEDLAAEETVQE